MVPEPPVTVVVTVPLAPPLQLTLVLVIPKTIAAGSITLIELVIDQPFASCTTTE